MPNNQLVDQILSLAANATPTERLVLKLAAALIKQIDPQYSVLDDTDERIRVPEKEWIGCRADLKYGTASRAQRSRRSRNG